MSEWYAGFEDKAKPPRTPSATRLALAWPISDRCAAGIRSLGSQMTDMNVLRDEQQGHTTAVTSYEKFLSRLSCGLMTGTSGFPREATLIVNTKANKIWGQ